MKKDIGAACDISKTYATPGIGYVKCFPAHNIYNNKLVNIMCAISHSDITTGHVPHRKGALHMSYAWFTPRHYNGVKKNSAVSKVAVNGRSRHQGVHMPGAHMPSTVKFISNILRMEKAIACYSYFLIINLEVIPNKLELYGCKYSGRVPTLDIPFQEFAILKSHTCTWSFVHVFLHLFKFHDNSDLLKHFLSLNSQIET